MPTPPRLPVLAGAGLLVLVAGALFAFDLGRYPLWDPDEARHAEVAREMAGARGLARLVLPTLEHRPYREKPAPYYGLVTLAYALGGVGSGAARAPSAAAALATVLAVYLWAIPRAGLAGATASGLFLATTVGWLAFARSATLDMTFGALVTAAVLAGLAWLERPGPRRPPWSVYGALGLAMAVKGPLAILLVGGPLVLAAWTWGVRPARAEMAAGRGALLAIAPSLVYWLPAALLDPDYARHFLATHVRRLEGDAPHARPIWFHLPWLTALALPWTLLAVPGVVASARDPARRPLVLWAAFVVALMSAVPSKLPSYLLPALPPLALAAGPTLGRIVVGGDVGATRPWLLAGGVLTVGLLVATAGAGLLAAPAYGIPPGARAAIAVTALAAAALGLALLARGRLRWIPALVAGATLVLFGIAVRGVLPAVSAARSAASLAAMIPAGASVPVVAFGAMAPSLTFYRGVPALRTDDPQVVQDLFAVDAPAFLVTTRRHYAEVDRLLGPRAHVWLETPRRRLYGNRPPPAGRENGLS